MDIFWYCILEISFYLSLMCSLLTDVRRHDFYQMVVHHTVVLVLISFSWGLNLVRIGTLFMCLHDVSDIFLEVSKCLIYMKSQIALAVMSVIFAFIWILTRIVICPYIIIIATRYAVTDHPTLVHLYTFVPLLVVLQVLNVYWTVMLIKYFRSTWDTSNKKVKDARSSDEEESEHED